MTNARRFTETQVESFNDIQEQLGERQQAVLDVLEVTSNFTAREVADLVNRETHQTTPRIRELMDKGLVREAGKKVCSKTKRMVTTYRKATDTEAKNHIQPSATTKVNVDMGINFNYRTKQWVIYLDGKIIGNSPRMGEASKILEKAYMAKFKK